MGWYYRRSKSVGPFRVNLSKSGVGFSVGRRGFRSGINSRGRRYSSVSVPGTGMRYYKSGGSASSGCLILFALITVSCGMALGCFVLFLGRIGSWIST